jgi:hypothetical protein
MTETGILNALPGALKANGPNDEGYRVFFSLSSYTFSNAAFLPNIFSDAPRVYVYPHNLYLSTLNVHRYENLYTWMIQ